jgi:hypothetical protein
LKLIKLPSHLSLSKRTILIICIVIIVIIPLILSFFISSHAKNAGTMQKGSITVNVSPTPTQFNPFPNGKIYSLPKFSVAYPKGSKNTVNVFVGGSTIIIQPPISSYPGEPIFDIEAYSSHQNLIQKEYLYLATGAKKSTIVVNNMTLPELKATYKIRTINSKPVRTPTQLRLAYLVKPHALYVFRMYYSSNVPIPEDENLYLLFIKSFSLKQ